MRSIIVIVLILVILAAITLGGKGPEDHHFSEADHSESAGAHDHQHSFGDDNAAHRKCQVTSSSPHEVVVQSVGNGSNPDKIHFKVAAQPGSPARFHVVFTSPGSKALMLAVSFTELFEWTENTTEGAFDGYEPDESEDVIVKAEDFSGTGQEGWRDIPEPTVTNLSSGAKIYQLTISYPHPANISDDLLILHVTIAEEEYSLNGITYPANSVKIDVEVNNWAFIDQGDYLGIKAVVQSNEGRKRWEHRESHGIVSSVAIGGDEGDGTPKILFNWFGTLEADGQILPVFATSLHTESQLLSDDGSDDEVGPPTHQAESANSIFFSFNKTSPSHVFWDPALQGSLATSALPLFFILLTCVLTTLL